MTCTLINFLFVESPVTGGIKRHGWMGTTNAEVSLRNIYLRTRSNTYFNGDDFLIFYFILLLLFLLQMSYRLNNVTTILLFNKQIHSNSYTAFNSQLLYW
jgi:hypothetical protein